MTEASRIQKLLNEQNAEIDRLKARIEKLEAALHQWDHLIAHQFPYSKAAMSTMTEAAQITAALLHGEAPWPETRIEKLEAALRELSTDWDCCVVSKNMKLIARKALEGKDD